MSKAASPLELDAQSLSPDQLSMPALMRELELQRRPHWLLRTLMNALERKRQAQGLGWSRPWNKVGLNVFRTHQLDQATDTEALTPALHFIQLLLRAAPDREAAFFEELINDPGLMIFTFYHNREAEDGQYEGLTLSFGRRVQGDRSKRDRLDLILEDRREEGAVDGRVDLVRLYVCPWANYEKGRQVYTQSHTTFSAEGQVAVADLYAGAIELYHRWKGEEARQWKHWSAQYIDYFGPRSFIPQGTSFF